MKILLIEDNTELAQTMQEYLGTFYEVDITHEGASGITKGITPRYDLIILDVVLPDLSGVEVCKKIRSHGIMTPIMMLTAKDSVDQKVEALDAGADDYLTKPFSFKELMARIRAITRRPVSMIADNPITIGSLSIDILSHSVTHNGEPVNLRRKEFSLLEYLARHAGQVVTRQMILDHVWATENDTISNTVDVHINYLRNKIDRPFKSKLIRTVPGIGYKLEI